MPYMGVGGFVVELDFESVRGNRDDDALLIDYLDPLFLRYAVSPARPDMRVIYGELPAAEDCDEQACVNEQNIIVKKCPDGRMVFEFMNVAFPGCEKFGLTPGIYARAETSPDWSEVRITRYTDRAARFSLRFLIRYFFEPFVLGHDAVVYHSSAVDWKGEGYLFGGPSGTGKSTHSRLWVSEMGDCEIINGDSPLLRVRGGGIWVYGMPWCGTSGESINRGIPLKAIICLEQAPHNRARRLEGAEAFWRAFPGCRRPGWNEARMDYALKTMEKIVEKTPVFVLECLPDADAVRVCREALAGV